MMMMKNRKQEEKAVIKESIDIAEALNTVMAQYSKEKLAEGNMSPDQVLICIFSALCKVQMQIVENLILGKAMKEGDFDTVYNSISSHKFHPSLVRVMEPLVSLVVQITGAEVRVEHGEQQDDEEM